VNLLKDLPQPSVHRIAVQVTKAGLRAVRQGSPWLYDQAVISHKPHGECGDLAVVFDDERRFAGIGLWDPNSPIRIKMLHSGKPTTIDAGWWKDRLQACREFRNELLEDGSSTGFRWVHGENDGLPGLIVDQYSNTVVVKLYSAAWFAHLASVVEGIVAVSTPERIVLRFSRTVRAGNTFGLEDGATIYGSAPDAPIMFLENGLHFEADVVQGHKTGHFLDQRDNRAIVRKMVEEQVQGGNARCSVLDVFSSTGGFTVSAAAGGAATVHMVDVSGPALATAHRNLAHNTQIPAIGRCAVTDIRGDAFAMLEEMVDEGRTFDIVILDPPSFAQNQESVHRALGSYGRLAKLGMALTANGGTLVQASCSSRIDIDQLIDVADAAARASGVYLDEIRRTEHPVDHPIGFEFGAYLKALYFTISHV